MEDVPLEAVIQATAAVAEGREIDDVDDEAAIARSKKQLSKRKNRNRTKPLEVSSARPTAPSARAVVAVPSGRGRDPRFSDISGRLDADAVRRNYGFLEDLRAEEKRNLVEQFRNAEGKRKERLRSTLDRIKSAENARAALDLRQSVRRELFRAERELVARTGKRPFVPSAAAVERAVRQRRAEQLSAEGRLAKALARRRKRQAAKDRAFMPGATGAT